MRHPFCLVVIVCLALTALAGCAGETDSSSAAPPQRESASIPDAPEPADAAPTAAAEPSPTAAPAAPSATPGAAAPVRVLQPEEPVHFVGETLWLLVAASDPEAFGAATLGGAPLEGDLLRLVTSGELRDGAPSPDRTPRYVLSSVQAAEPGVRELNAGDKTLAIGAGAPAEGEPDSGLPAFRIHPPPMRAGMVYDCALCHETAPGTPKLISDRVDMATRCIACHEEGEFVYVHEHNVNSLQNCVLCHDLHGSSKPKMLKEPRDKVCGYCHEPHGTF